MTNKKDDVLGPTDCTVDSEALIPDPGENLSFIGISPLSVDHFTKLSSFALDFFDLGS